MVNAYKELSDLISKRLLGVLPDDQDLTLEDDDWRIIINALSSYAMQEDEEPGASERFGRALSELPRLAHEAGCFVGVTVTAAKPKSAEGATP